MNKPTWIIFDVGGVLLDWPTSSTKTAEFLGVTHDELFDVLFDQTVEMNIGAKMNIGEISAHDGWTEILARLKKDHAPDEIISRWYAEEFWLEDTLKLLTELKSKGYKLAIMSNSWLGLTDPTKQHIFPKQLQLFDKVFDSSQEKMKKPDQKFYELVEKGTGVRQNNLFFIDDDKKNLDIAASRHWQTFLYDMRSDRGIEANTALREKLL